ncbi:GntR family transcriptional regulator [Serinibacter salmoneus]|uniref:DNA-binding transcriptional regulator YhcF (GntR family) n=1 Tax=Serinibacter salmoneus TaxID=556530 RepID=A0A2A9D051_9MICO|nr:GntR family transcriptional regulator [Serinibacter salmoneus]PFG19219.1 DNA-binding transcriptional regulator YhcF (GntR family) [Serinibacter salmoneus]
MFDGPEPLYVQIAAHVRDLVLAGDLAEEEQVMSTTQFATTYRINPATAAKAFAGLVEEGVLYKRRGLGMFVAPGARERLLGSGREAYFAEVLDPALDQAERLGISTDEVHDYIAGRAALPAGRRENS